MGDATGIHRNLVEYTNYLYNEGYLERQYFRKLQELQHEGEPNFMFELVSSFFQNFPRNLNEITVALNEQLINFNNVSIIAYRLKGSSSSVGAQRLQNACTILVHNCEQQNTQGCLQCLHQLEVEYDLVKSKLERLFKLEQELVAAGGSVPVIV